MSYIICDEMGDHLLAGCTPICPPGSVLAAELEAVRIGLERCIHKQLAQVEVRTDSLMALEAIADKMKYFGPEATMITQIHELNLVVLARDLMFVPRQVNTVATSSPNL